MVATKRREFTIDEYHRLIDWGFFAKERVELIRGELIKMSPKRTRHSVCNSLLWKALYDLLGKQVEIRVQEPIFLPPNSEPDLVIAVAQEDNYLSSHPTPEDILLAIEIADSTLQSDRQEKLSLYAEAGISNYWIFNSVENHLEVYTQPFLDNKSQFAYRSRQIILTEETINIPTFNDITLNLTEVFPERKQLKSK